MSEHKRHVHVTTNRELLEDEPWAELVKPHEVLYAQGGYVTGPDGSGAINALIHPDECLLAKRGESLVCVRDHEHNGRPSSPHVDSE